MVLTNDQYDKIVADLRLRANVGTPDQRKVSKDLMFYFNLFGDSRDTAVIDREIEKSIGRWKKQKPDKTNAKGIVMECTEVRISRKCSTLLEEIVKEYAVAGSS